MKRKSSNQEIDSESHLIVPSAQVSLNLGTIFENEYIGQQLGFGGNFSLTQSQDQFDQFKTFSFDSQTNGWDPNILQQNPFSFTADDSPRKSDLVVPHSFNIDESTSPAKYQLREKRNTDYIKDLASFDNDANDNDNEDSETVVVRKKRPYYRKNKHPKEVLEKVEAERLKKKRLKNRELAARSRKKKKERMSSLEEENEQLKLQLARAQDALRQCTCGRS